MQVAAETNALPLAGGRTPVPRASAAAAGGSADRAVGKSPVRTLSTSTLGRGRQMKAGKNGLASPAAAAPRTDPPSSQAVEGDAPAAVPPAEAAGAAAADCCGGSAGGVADRTAGGAEAKGTEAEASALPGPVINLDLFPPSDWAVITKQVSALLTAKI